jgi:hypothetical protein
MLTAIFVYDPASIHIRTCESDLKLCRMGGGVLPLSGGENVKSLDPGIYKIVSSQDVQVTGDISTFDLVASSVKDNNPKRPPIRASTTFAPLDDSALQAFLTVPEAKHVLNP